MGLFYIYFFWKLSLGFRFSCFWVWSSNRIGNVSPGADDNGSGVCALVEVAEKLKREPDLSAQIFVVFSGAEELGVHGAFRFWQNHRQNSLKKRIVLT